MFEKARDVALAGRSALIISLMLVHLQCYRKFVIRQLRRILSKVNTTAAVVSLDIFDIPTDTRTHGFCICIPEICIIRKAEMNLNEEDFKLENGCATDC